MKTHVMGQKVNKIYKLDIKKDNDGQYLKKPEIVLDNREVEYEEILSYEGRKQGSFSICLSEDEEVLIDKEKFRADLGDWYQYVNKVLEEKDNKADLEDELKEELKLYNIQKIMGNDKAKVYCDLHKLDYSETDYDELLKIIGNNESYVVSLKDVTGITINKSYIPGITIDKSYMNICSSSIDYGF